jgi:acyl-CoA dehydrogenase
MIDLEIPKKLRPLVTQAHLVAENVLRPISRKYDSAEHAYPEELDTLAALLDGLAESGGGASAGGLESKGGKLVNQTAVLGMIELCWGDVGLALTLPRQGLGNAAVAAVASREQKKALARRWIAMAITEPSAGSDSAAIRTTARKDGDHYVLDGEKIFVTAGERCDAVVVWASLDRSLGRAAIKAFLVTKDTPGLRVARLEHKLGIRASDTATLVLENCRVPAENLLGSPEIDTSKAFAGAMKTFDNTRPVIAAMAIGVARAALERARELLAPGDPSVRDRRPTARSSHAAHELFALEAELEAARLLAMRAAWMADRGMPNSLEASMAKAKAGRLATELTLTCVELCGAVAYSERELLEKWARDAKILDIFEGTQQIQLLIVARRVLGKSSSELR